MGVVDTLAKLRLRPANRLPPRLRTGFWRLLNKLDSLASDSPGQDFSREAGLNDAVARRVTPCQGREAAKRTLVTRMAPPRVAGLERLAS